MQFKFTYILLFISYYQIECFRIGFIQNVSLTGENGFEKNGTSCDECACLLAMNTTFVSFNCYLLNKSCEIFSSYNLIITYQLKYNFNSTFFFIQLPPTLPITSASFIQTTIIQNAYTISANSVITAAKSITTTMGVTTTSTADPCSYTVAGRYNSTWGTDNSSLKTPIDIFINRNGSILYVGEYGNSRVQAFQLPSKSVTTVPTSVYGVLGIYYDDDTSKLYLTQYISPKLSIWPSGQTLPLSGVTTGCTAAGGWYSVPYGVVTDRQGNIYVSHNSCNTVVKWTPNATIPILIGGDGTLGNNSQQLNSPRRMYLDEANSLIYVADTNNHRIQRFSTNGISIDVTMAGGHSQGAASNQLNSPTGVYVSPKDGSIYISDQMNNRIQKWPISATYGVTVAGDSNGTSGNGPFALNQPFAVILDRNETYIYVADYNSNRVQRYPVV